MSIDERIVQMEFDNKQFERGAEQSMRTLDMLKKSLILDSQVDSLNELQLAGNSFTLSGMSEGLQEFKANFSALGVVGFTVIQNLTNSAMNAGKRIARALTSPLIEGGARRALNIEQAMFQFEGLGMDVEATMDSALQAVLGTAFGLDEAAVAASQFGATGMRAGEDMTSALRAISGVAAMTGSEYSDISRVFTTVAGNGRLMGNELLRLSTRGINAAATLAEHFGITEEAVRDMVSSGEISFEMFYQSMDAAFGEHATRANETYTGSLSNMRAALARIGATIQASKFENLRQVFNALTPVIDDVHDAIEPLLEVMDLLMKAARFMAVQLLEATRFNWLDDRMDSIIYAVDNAVRSLAYSLLFMRDVMRPIRDAFSVIFPPIAGERIEALSDGFRRFFESLRVSETTADNIRRTFMGIFSVVDIGVMIADSLVRIMLGIIGVSAPMGEGLLFITAAIGDMVTKLRNFLRSSGVFQKIASVTVAIITPVIRAIGTAFQFLGQAIDHFMGADVEGVSGFFNRLAVRFEPVLNLLRRFVDGFWNVLNSLKILGPAFEAIVKNVYQFWSRLVNAIFGEGADIERNLDIINKLLTGGIFVAIIRFFTHLTETVETGGGFFSSIKRYFKGLLTTLKMYQVMLSARALIKIAIAIAVLTASLIALSLIDPIKLTQALIAMGLMFKMLSITLVSVKSLLGDSIKTFGELAGIVFIITGTATAIRILTSSVMAMASLEWGELIRGLAGLAILLSTLVGVSYLLKKSKAEMITGSMGLIALSTSLFIMSRVVKELGEMDWKVMTRGLGGVIGMILAVGAAMMMMGKGGKLGFMQMLGIRSIAASLAIFQRVVEKFGEMDASKLTQGLTAMAYAMVILSASVAIMNSQAGGATAMLKVAGAMILLSGAIFILGNLPFEVVSEGLTVLALTLGVLALGLYAIGKAGVTAVPSMVGLAGAILLLTPSLLLLGMMSREGVTNALTAVGGSLIAFAGGLWMLGNLGKKGATGAGVLALAALALMLLVPPLIAFAMIPSEKIGQSLGILAFSLAAMSIALHYMEGSIKGAGALAIVAASLMLLILPLRAFGNLDNPVKSLIVLGVVLGALTGVMFVLTKLANANVGSILSAIAVFPAIALSLLLIGRTLQQFADMSWGDIGRALTVLGVTFLGMIIAILALGKLIVASMGVILAAIAVLPVIAISMMLMVNPLREFGEMDASKIAKSLAIIGLGLIPLAIGVTAMTAAIVGAPALLLIAYSLTMLIPVLIALDDLSWSTILSSLAKLTVVLVGMSVVTAILALLSPVILAFGLSLGVLSLALVGIAASAAIFAGAMTIIGKTSPAIGSAMEVIANLFYKFLELIREAAPKIAKTFGTVLDAILGIIEKYAPRVIVLLTNLIISGLKAVRRLAPEYVDMGVVIIENFLRGVESTYGSIARTAVNIPIIVLNTWAEGIPRIIDAGIGVILAFIVGLAKGIERNTQAFTDAGIRLRNAIFRAMVSIPLRMVGFGEETVEGFIQGLREKAADARDRVAELASSMLGVFSRVLGIRSPSKEFYDRGEACIDGTVDALEDGKPRVEKAAEDTANALHDAFEATSEQRSRRMGPVFGLRDIIDFRPQSGGSNMIGPITPEEFLKNANTDVSIGEFVEGVSDGGLSWAEQFLKNMMGIGDPEATKTGEGLGEGLGESLGEGLGEGLSDAFQKAVQKIQDDKFFGIIDSLEEELERWKDLMKEFGHEEEAQRRISREKHTIRQNIIDKAFNDELANIRHLDRIEQITDAEKLQRKKDLLELQDEGSDRQIQMIERVHSAQETLIRNRIANSRDWIAEMKHFGTLGGMRGEMDALERMINDLDPHSPFKSVRDDHKRLRMDIFALQKQMTDKEEEIQNGIQQLYEDGYERRKRLEKDYRDEVANTKKQLERDIEDVTRQYINAIDSRADALYSTTGLFDEIRTVDEDVTSDDLMNNLQGQVDQFYYWRKMLEDLTDRGLPSGLMDELTEMGPSSLHQLRALGSMSEGELDKYVGLWETKHKQAREQSVKELEPLRIETEEEIERLTKQAGKDLETLNTNLANDLQAVTDTTLGSLRTMTMGWLEELGDVTTDSEKAVLGLADTIREKIRGGDWEAAAKPIPEGVAVGIKDNQKKAINAVKDMGLESLRTLNNVFDTRSPSREFYKIGAFCMEGFTNGLRSLAGLAVNTIIRIGELVKETFIGSLSSIMDLVDMDDDYQPTIRPVLDLSDMRSGSRSLDSMMGDRLISSELKGVDLSGVGEFKKMTKSIKQSLDKLIDIHKNNPPVHNHFDVSGITIREEADIDRIARELYQLQIATDRG